MQSFISQAKPLPVDGMQKKNEKYEDSRFSPHETSSLLLPIWILSLIRLSVRQQSDITVVTTAKVLQKYLPPVRISSLKSAKNGKQKPQKASELGIRVVMVRIGLVLWVRWWSLATGTTTLQDGESAVYWVMASSGCLGSILTTSSVLCCTLWIAPKFMGALNANRSHPSRNTEFTKTLGAVLRRPTLFPVPVFGLKLMMGEFADFIVLSQNVIPERTEASGYEFYYRTLESALNALL